MSGGKRYKFTGTTIGILIGFDDDALDITGITNTNPVVLSIADHGRAPGDVVRLSGIVGMTELNDVIGVVQAVGAGTITLAGINATEYGAYVSGGEAEVANFSNFCELTDFNRAGGSSPEIQADTLCSEAAEFELGLPDYGTTTLSYNFAPRTAIQGRLQEANDSGEKIAIKVKLPNNGGEMVQMGMVQQTSETSGRGGLWTGSATIRNTGKRVDIAAS